MSYSLSAAPKDAQPATGMKRITMSWGGSPAEDPKYLVSRGTKPGEPDYYISTFVAMDDLRKQAIAIGVLGFLVGMAIS